MRFMDNKNGKKVVVCREKNRLCVVKKIIIDDKNGNVRFVKVYSIIVTLKQF